MYICGSDDRVVHDLLFLVLICFEGIVGLMLRASSPLTYSLRMYFLPLNFLT